MKILTTKEIANHLVKRSYFFPNHETGIKTFEDPQILNELLNGWPFDDDNRKELVEYLLTRAFNYYRGVEVYYKGMSFIEAVKQAANAKVPSSSTSCSRNGTSFAGHQRRVGKKKCKEGAEMLLKHPYWGELEKAQSFEDIFKVTEQVKRNVLKLGDLWSYDTAQRIALHKGWYPQDVYLQSGAYNGIQILRDKGFIDNAAIKGKRYISVKAIPEFLSKLEPFLIENILCVGKREGWFK
ncbi:MAG: hypothetical protein ACJA2S_004478 [Cyclobacteriaceae bacterium]